METFSQEAFSGNKKVVASGVILSRGSEPITIKLNKGTESEITTLFNFRVLEDSSSESRISMSPIGGSSASFSIDIEKGRQITFTAKGPFAESIDSAVSLNMVVRCTATGHIHFTYTFFSESITIPEVPVKPNKAPVRKRKGTKRVGK